LHLLIVKTLRTIVEALFDGRPGGQINHLEQINETGVVLSQRRVSRYAMLFSYPLLLDEQNNVLLAEFIVNFFLFLVLEPGLA